MDKDLMNLLNEFCDKLSQMLNKNEGEGFTRTLCGVHTCDGGSGGGFEEFVESKKWNPEGGKWYCGPVNIKRDPDNWYEQNSSDIGRRYETKEQAEQALIFQHRAMRFFRWCVQQDPEFEADDLFSFQYLLIGELADKLQKAEDSGEVEF